MQNYNSIEFLNVLLQESIKPMEDYYNFKYPVATTSFAVNRKDINKKFLKSGVVKTTADWDKEVFEVNFTNALKKQFKTNNIEVKYLENTVASDEIQVNMSIVSTEDGLQINIDRFFNEAQTVSKTLLEYAYVQHFLGSIWINSQLKTKIQYPTINMDFNQNTNVSLKDIHKLLDTETILIQGGQNVSSNVLGLLKIKNLKQIVSLEFKDIKWLDFIKNHLQGGRDVLKCQDQLLDAGLKEYAKL